MPQMPQTQILIDEMPPCGTIRQSSVRAERVGRGNASRIVWLINGNRCSRKDAEKFLSPTEPRQFSRPKWA